MDFLERFKGKSQVVGKSGLHEVLQRRDSHKILEDPTPMGIANNLIFRKK